MSLIVHLLAESWNMTDPSISERDKKNGVVQRLEQAKSRLEIQAMQSMQTCEELAAARDAAVAASDRKSAFIANASHEMRTPLSGVIGLTEMVLDTDLTDEQREN